MRRLLVALGAVFALTLPVMTGAVAEHGDKEIIHASGGGKTNEGQHFDFSVKVATDEGHLKFSTDTGLSLVCKGKESFVVKGKTYTNLMFAVIDQTDRLEARGDYWTKLEGSVLGWAECVDRNRALVYVVDVGLH